MADAKSAEHSVAISGGSISREGTSASPTTSSSAFISIDEAFRKIVEARSASSAGAVSGQEKPDRVGENAEIKAELLSGLRALDGGAKGFLTESEWRQAFVLFPELLSENRSGLPMAEVGWFWDVPASQFLASFNSLKSGLASITERIAGFLESFLSGGIAGAVAKTIIAPGDRVKIIYQVSADRVFTFANAFKTGARIVERGGFLGLWRGHGATLLRVVPYASISFGTFPHYETLFGVLLGAPKKEEEKGKGSAGHGHGHGHGGGGTNDGGLSVARRFLSGAAAGATATAATYPLDLLRARFAAHWSFETNRYPSYLSAIREIKDLEGWRALYSGLKPTIAGIMPYAGLSFCAFETFKHQWVKAKGLKEEKEIKVWHRLLMGSMAGWIAQSATYPLDIVRRRMQVHPERYSSIRHALTDIYMKEGLKKGLFKGVSMNWVKGPIAVATSFTVNDEIKNRIRLYHAHVIADTSGKGLNELSIPELVLCGGAAGGLAKLWTTPFDRMKIIYSIGLASADEHNYASHAVRTMKDLFRHVTPSSGYLWQGSGAMMMRAVPYAAISYSTFDPWRRFWQRASFSPESHFMVDFAGGASAACLATVLTHPIDVLRVRNAANMTGQKYPSYLIGLRETINVEGCSSLWVGIKPAVLGIAPMAGFGFALYEWGKTRYQLQTFGSQLGAGMAAGCTAMLLTYPLNIVRRRAQAEVLEGTLGGHRPTGVLESIYRIASREGFYGGLYSRMPMGWVFGSTTIGLSFALNDCFKRLAKERRSTLYRNAVER
jgi:solute carrier family 25 protein 42